MLVGMNISIFSRPVARRRPPGLPASLLALALSVAAGAAQAQAVAVNQVGYLPGGAKWAVLPAAAGDEFRLVRAGSGEVVLRGRLGPAQTWAPAGQAVRLADFTSLSYPGEDELRAEGVPASPRIRFAADVSAGLTAACLNAFYFNRASVALDPRQAGRLERPAGHPVT